MSAASQQSTWPATRTASTRSTPETSLPETLVFRIDEYSLHKGLCKGEFIQSAAFNVGGYRWCIRYYPNGDARKESTDHISVYLELLSQKAAVRAYYDLRLVNQRTGLSTSILRTTEVFGTIFLHENIYTWGHSRFLQKGVLEESPSKYLLGDCLVIHCDITIIEARVPPSVNSDEFRRLLESGEGADVTFRVSRDIFPAHRKVLAERSPVFKAQLYGPVGEGNREFITIEDIQPGIFKALLHFAYTDSLPDMEDIELDEIHEDEDIVKQLLVAADKYAMERLKLVCSDMLCKSLNVRTVADTLALADLHSCSELKRACVKYIMASGRARDVMASHGYQHLKDLWEKSIN